MNDFKVLENLKQSLSSEGFASLKVEVKSSDNVRRTQNLKKNPLFFKLLSNVKQIGRVFKIFVAFSEYQNFMPV